MTMMRVSSFVKRVRYFIDAASLIRIVSNWAVIPLAYFKIIDLSKGRIIRLKNGKKFRVSNVLEILALKEIFLVKDYPFRSGKKKNIIIDVGANIGAFTVFAASQSPQNLVYSVEPSKKTFEFLLFNLQLNKVDLRVVPINVGIYEKRTRLKLFSCGPSGLRSIYRNRNEKNFELVKTITLPQLFDRYKISRCDFLKIDCEGAEYGILKTCPERVFKKIRTIALEFHEFSPDQRHEQLVEILKKHHFTVRSEYHPIESNLGYVYAVNNK